MLAARSIRDALTNAAQAAPTRFPWTQREPGHVALAWAGTAPLCQRQFLRFTWDTRDLDAQARPACPVGGEGVVVMTSDVATVFVIDDDASVRTALDRLLRAAGWNVRTYASAHEFLDELPDEDCGCILLDVSMPGMAGPELHSAIMERGMGYPVVYLTGHCSLATGVNAMKAGALDLLEKPLDDDKLLQAIANAISRDAENRASHARRGAIRTRLATLSRREYEVLEHVVKGRLNKQIAADLGIAEKTVKVHRGRMMTKMGVRSVAQLVHQCDDLDMINVD